MPLDMLEKALPALVELTRSPRGSARGPDVPSSGPDPGDAWQAPLAARGRIDSAIDWAMITDALGTPLPEDYRELAQRYQGLVIDNWLGIRMPRPGLEDCYVDAMREDLLGIEDAWMTGDSGGHVPYPRPRGLMPWGGSIDGDAFYWRTHPDGPEAWTVVVCDARNHWKEVNRDLTGYLAGLVLGEVEPSERLPQDFAQSAPSVTVDGSFGPLSVDERRRRPSDTT